MRFLMLKVDPKEGFKDSRGPGIKRERRGCREDAESNDQIPGKQTLESSTPETLSTD